MASAFSMGSTPKPVNDVELFKRQIFRVREDRTSGMQLSDSPRCLFVVFMTRG